MTTIPCISYTHATEQMGYWQKKGYVTSTPKFDGRDWYITYTTWAEYREVKK